MCFSIWCLILTKTIDRSLLALGDTKSLAYLALCRLIFCTLFSYVGYRVAALQGFCIGVGVGSSSRARCSLSSASTAGELRSFGRTFDFSLIAMSVAAGILTLQNERVLNQACTKLRRRLYHAWTLDRAACHTGVRMPF